MAIFQTQSKSVRWLLAELTVVVLGILIAFQIDQWNTNRNNRQEEIAALHGIISDLKAEQTDAERVRLIAERIALSSRQLVEYLGTEDQLSGQHIADLWTDIIFGSSWVTGAATYESLKENGRLQIISDTDLQQYLRTYYENWVPAQLRFNETSMAILDDLTDAASVDLFLYSSPSAPELEQLQIFSRSYPSGVFRHVALRTPFEIIPTSMSWLALLNRVFTRFDGMTQRSAASRDMIDQLILALEASLMQLEGN